MHDEDPPVASPEDRTMSLIGVIGWTLLVVLLFSLILSLSASVRPGLANELVNLQICFGLALAAGALLITRLHLPTRNAFDAIGVRVTPWWFVLAGLLVGLLLQLPALWVDGWLTEHWPLGVEEQSRQLALFSFQSTAHKAAFVIAATLIGPMVEEVFCRGALFRTLRRSYSPWATVVITTFSFAALHLDPRYALNAALCGFVLGALRLWSGTLWVSLAAHVAFNSVTTVALLGGWVKLGELQEPLAIHWGLLGAIMLALLLLVLYKRSQGVTLVQHAVAADSD